MTNPIPLRVALKASVDHPDEIELYARLRDSAITLAEYAEDARLLAIRGEKPSIEALMRILTATHLADQAALAYAAARGVNIKSAAELC
jgi:hypothetical protein